ncbi:MAG TPA: DNA polymerase Y family protein [Candidatus Dormibacteraeota bacterium]
MSSPTRLACLTFPHLSLVLIGRAHPELREEPVLVGGEGPGGRRLVVAASPAAWNRGVRPGQDWRRAVVLCPLAAQLDVDLAAVAELRRQARLALTGCSPLVEWGDDASAYVDLRGSDPLRAEEGSRAVQCGRALQEALGVTPSVGVGPSRFSAWAAAQLAAPGRVRSVPVGKAVEFLANWPVTALPIPPEIAERLRQFGLRTCGDCAAITLVDLQRQFGPEGILLHRLCRGQDSAGIDPWREPPPCGVRRVLAGGVEDSESLRFGAAELARGLAQELVQQGRAAGRIRLVLLGEDGLPALAERQVWWGEVAPPAPMATAEELLGPLLSLFGRARPSAPVTVVELAAFDLVAAPVRELGLWQGLAADREMVQRAVDRLHDRFGRGLVWQVEVRPGHRGDVPEERLVWSSR